MTNTTPETDSQRRAAVVYNPIKVDLDAIRAAVATQEQAAGWGETMWFETSKEDPGQGATRDALEAGAAMVIAAGGDGTVRAVAEALNGPDVPLALLPSGTGNLLARNLHLTLDDMDHSLKSAFSGKDRAIDLARIRIRHEDDTVSEHVYVVMAGLGIDAKMLAATDEDLKKKVGWLAYVGAIITALRDKNQLRLRYQLDDSRPKSIRAHTIIAGNCGALTGNVLLLPDAAVDDGMLDIVLMRPEGFIGWTQIIVKVIWENGVLRRTKLGQKFVTKEVDALNYVRGQTLKVRLSRAEKIELDGDEFGEAIALKTWIQEGGLTIRVPADS
jgi:diacylglycerol kinase family enzyme